VKPNMQSIDKLYPASITMQIARFTT